jgi:hypothetical protein
MIVIEMREGNDIVAVPFGCLKIFLQFCEQIDPLVLIVLWITSVRIVKEKYLAVRGIDTAAVGVS